MNKLLFLLILSFIACIQSAQEAKECETNAEPTQKIRRFESVIKIKPDLIEQYKNCIPWPEVQEQIHESNIRNYSIYLKDDYLFSYFDYVGDDFEADMNKMAKLIRQVWSMIITMDGIPYNNNSNQSMLDIKY